MGKEADSQLKRRTGEQKSARLKNNQEGDLARKDHNLIREGRDLIREGHDFSRAGKAITKTGL